MATKTLPILPGVVLAYDDLWRVLRAMRTLMAYAVMIVLAFKVLDEVIPARTMSNPLLAQFIDLAIGVAQSFCLTPIMIAVHRFIVLDEAAPAYAIDVSEPRFIAFFSWLVGLSLLSAAVFSTQELLTAAGIEPRTAVGPTLMVAIVAAILLVRFSILFPAIATGARAATAGNALAASKGHVLSMFLIYLLALLPMAALAIGSTVMLGRGMTVRGSPVAVLDLVLGGFLNTIVIVLCVAVASRIFQSIGSPLRAGDPAR
ncbi:MAG TPA: hypothetical protein VGC38_02330 [Pseudolabrys sp.]